MCVCGGVQGQTRVSSSLMVSTAALAVSFVSSQSSSLPPTELPSSLVVLHFMGTSQTFPLEP